MVEAVIGSGGKWPHNSTRTASGNIITQPVTGWSVASIFESAILLQIRYVESSTELEEGRNKSFQFVLTPPKCLELAEMLTKQAQRLRDDKLPPGKSPN
jgi:hypothetical protein